MHNAYYNCTNLPFPVAGSSDKLSSPGVSVKPIRSTNSIHHNGTAHTRTHAHTHARVKFQDKFKDKHLSFSCCEGLL